MGAKSHSKNLAMLTWVGYINAGFWKGKKVLFPRFAFCKGPETVIWQQ